MPPEPIFINGRFLAQPVSGVQRYAREIVHALDRMDRARDYVLIAPAQAARDLALGSILVRRLPGDGHVWEQTTLLHAAWRGRLLSLGGSGPLLHPRQTVVIHDAAVFRRPEHFRPGYARLHRLIGRALARRARLATVSDFSRAELADVLKRPPATIAVAPNGADHFGRIAPSAGIVDRLGLADHPFFVALGNLAPNKNVGAMLRALRRLPDSDIRLVLVGGLDPKVFASSLDQDDPRIMLAGRLPDAEIAGLLRAARALVFASLYEGFGIPPLEAFAQGCPVIASDIPAVREVCGEAAVLFDPHDPDALAVLMRQALDGPPSKQRQALAHERLRAYRWETSAAVLDALVRTPR